MNLRPIRCLTTCLFLHPRQESTNRLIELMIGHPMWSVSLNMHRLQTWFGMKNFLDITYMPILLTYLLWKYVEFSRLFVNPIGNVRRWMLCLRARFLKKFIWYEQECFKSEGKKSLTMWQCEPKGNGERNSEGWKYTVWHFYLRFSKLTKTQVWMHLETSFSRADAQWSLFVIDW